MQDERPTFSPFWHRVRALKPRLRPHTQITRQHYRGRRWHVVHDPATNQFYRLSPIAHEFVGLLDGRRTIEDVWQSVLRKHADDAPTQGECIQLISQLYNANLLHADTTPETEQLLRRGREREAKKAKQQLIGLMYFRLRLFNPDWLISKLEPLLRPVINRWGFFAWLAFLLYALAMVLPEFDRLREGFGSTIAPSNWGWLIVVFVVTKFIHEMGHGIICKRFGGQVPEFGVMLLVLFPAPYVDASACWAFPDKWKRIAVGAGGMLFELFVASVAALVWLSTSPGQLAHQLAYNAMFTAGVSTVLFNANPLMRFDGYYMLSDLIEVPNLMQRSQNMLKHLAQRHIYRVRDLTPPSTIPAERAILVIYGVLAMAYRVFLFFSITLYVMGQMFAVGLFLAIWTAAAWFLLPAGAFIHWLATHHSLAEFRPRAILTSVVLAAIVLGSVGLIPWPDHRRGIGVVESVQKSGVFFGVEGFVARVHVRPGDAVAAGDPIVTLTSPELDAQAEITRGTLREAEAVERRATAENPAAAQVARERIATIKEELAFLTDKQSKLIVRAPHAGVVVGDDPHRTLGAFVKAGDMLCEVADPTSLRITASLTQTEASWLFQLPRDQYRVEMRLHSRVDDIIRGGDVRVVDAGQRELPHAALGFGGGGTVETAADDQSGTVTKQTRFRVEIEPDQSEGWPGAPGERVSLRFTLPDKPLLTQWVDRLEKLLQGRAKL